MKLTSALIKEKAMSLGIDDIGIANIERFCEAPAMMDPLNYYEGIKSVIVVVQRIPRGSYRGIEEGTHWHNYTYYSYNRLNTVFRTKLAYKLSCFIEDFGQEAIAHFPGVPERNPLPKDPVRKSGLPANIMANIRILAAGAGVGEIGHSKVFLSRKFGPRVRLSCIFTDAVLEPDPMIEPGTICNRCGRCVRDCPGNAIPSVSNETRRINIKVGNKDISWGDVHMGRCTLTHHGFNKEISPFLKNSFPNMNFNVRESKMTEEEAYRLSYPMALAKWGITYTRDNSIIPYYRYIMDHVGYFAVCGAKGCIRACMDNLEKNGLIENTFENEFYRKKQWHIDMEVTEQEGKINPWRERYLEENYPGVTKGE